MVIHPQDVAEEGQDPRPLVLKRLVKEETHGRKLSMTWVRAWGHHERVVNEDSDRAYYILSGSGRFQVGDGEVEAVSEGDAVFIATGTPYEFDGEMTYVVVNGPAFATGSDSVLPSVMDVR